MRVTLSEKHGVNPSVTVCYLCGAEMGIALVGRLKGDAQAPRRIFDHHACDECKAHMQQGIILISIDIDRSPDQKNPYRTGGFAVVKESAIREMVQPPELMETICRKRVAFICNETWVALGLPELPRAN
jgi:CRISPR/Cas system-associated protein Cas10 (large subunit of type III CRISPR-Cas system)